MKTETVRTAFVLPVEMKKKFDSIIENEFYGKTGPFLRELIRAELERRIIK